MAEAPSIPFEPRRFRTSAEYYVRGRLAYPERLIERVVSLTGLGGSDAVLDLGCGPGFLAVAFAAYGGRVLGMDPEPAMLEIATEYARTREAAVEFRLGSSYDLDKVTGMFQLVTMGQSFHWMDRAATLEALDRIVAPGGAVALFRDSHLSVPQNRWREEFRAVLEPFAAKDTGHVRAAHRGSSWIQHEAVLLESKFNELERHSVIQRLKTPVERLIDRALSMSSTSPERLGEEMETMTGKLREVLNRYACDGVIAEVVESEALLAFRENT
jgi:ubiquinone/menaquinone biosynthesis C-methylase UbiE